MQGQMEVEEILEQGLWAVRNDAPMPEVYLPPGELLREHELRAYRDCPPDDVYDRLPFIPVGWWLVVVALAGAGVYLLAVRVL